MRPKRRDRNKNPFIKILFSTPGEANAGFFLLRVFIGIAFITHGYEKLFVNLANFVMAVEKMGLPWAKFLAITAACSEFFGGILLVFGLLTKISSFFLTCTMFVAVFIANAGIPFEKRELSIAYLICSILFMFKGAGKFSIDYLFFKNMNNSSKFKL